MESGTFSGTQDTVPSKMDKDPCPCEAYIMGEKRQNKN